MLLQAPFLAPEWKQGDQSHPGWQVGPAAGEVRGQAFPGFPSLTPLL